MINKNSCREKVEYALKGLNNALGEDDSYVNAFSSKEQLATFRRIFSHVLSELDAGVLPPKSQRNLGMAMIVIDCWPFDFYPGQLIIDAERAYKEL